MRWRRMLTMAGLAWSAYTMYRKYSNERQSTQGMEPQRPGTQPGTP